MLCKYKTILNDNNNNIYQGCLYLSTNLFYNSAYTGAQNYIFVSNVNTTIPTADHEKGLSMFLRTDKAGD